MGNKDLKEEIARLEEEIAELKRRWPAHSVKAEMVEQLEELEEKLERLRQMEQQEGASKALLYSAMPQSGCVKFE